MTPPPEDWPGLTSRVRGFAVGFCLGDALSSSPDGGDGVFVGGTLSRVFLNAALALDWALLTDRKLLDRRADDMSQDRRADAGLGAGDAVLARSLPLALALVARYPQTLLALSLVNAGWLGLLVDRCNRPRASASDVAVARVLVRNAARRLNAEPTSGFDTPLSLAALLPWHLGEGATPIDRHIIQGA